MSGKRIYAPSILIDSVEYKCFAQSVSLTPQDYSNFCEEDWEFSADIELGYGAAETWNLLDALDDTNVDIVLKPEDAAVAITNPTATFQIRMPAVAFLASTSRGDKQAITLTAMTLVAPVFATT